MRYMGYGWIFVGSFMGKDNQKPLMLNTIIYGWKIFNYQPTKCQWVYIYITPTSIGINMYNKRGKTFTATIMMRVLWGFAGDIQGNGV